MQNKIIIGILGLALVASALWIAHLTQRVAQLEKLVEPLKAQQAMESRQKALGERFVQRMAQDRAKYTPDQMQDAEKLYQVANQKWGTPEAKESLQAMVKKYPDLDRTGCAMLYLADMSKGDERAKYLQDCIDQYNDCFYGDGAQVGPYARFMLAEDYKSDGETEKAKALYNEIKAKYPDAIDHSGKLLVDLIPAGSKGK
jgi:TolA-binding protein